MRLKFLILISICFATLLVGCKKQSPVDVNNLYGKWKLVEIYDEYGSGPNGGWHDVSGQNLQIEFTVNGYKKTESSGGTSHQCSGTYKMSTQNKIEIVSTCDPTIESLTISQLTIENLILDHLGTEGIIRYKYEVNR